MLELDKHFPVLLIFGIENRIYVKSFTMKSLSYRLHIIFQTPSHPAQYKYDWRVQDAYSANDFGQEEARSGYNIDGGYSVLLPDGRKQIVTYKVADAHSGYVADVRYEGEGIYI